jgi:hypothetical protein
MNEPFKQLRIRAYLQTGVISDQFLPLDSILYYHLVRRTFGEEIITKPGESNVRQGANITLPIKKGGRKDDTWFYHCSFAQWPDSVIEDSSFKVKQGDWLRHTNFLEDRMKRVDIQRGKNKAYHIKMYYRHCNYVEWYCVGWPDKILELLQFCTNIGKNGGDGWGVVKNWEVQEWPEDWSVRGFGNKLMRAVPADGGYLYGVRPSYWNSRHIFPCKMPWNEKL